MCWFVIASAERVDCWSADDSSLSGSETGGPVARLCSMKVTLTNGIGLGLTTVGIVPNKSG